jgi:hypothetical protein
MAVAVGRPTGSGRLHRIFEQVSVLDGLEAEKVLIEVFVTLKSVILKYEEKYLALTFH